MLHQPADQFRPAALPTCPVAALARTFQRHVDLHNAIDENQDRRERQGATGSDAKAAEQIHDAVASAAPFMQALSAEGAMFQVIYAYGRASAMYDQFPEQSDDYAFVTEYMRETEAALTSVRRFLETHFQIDGRLFGGDYYMSDHASLVPRLERASRELLPTLPTVLMAPGTLGTSRVPELALQYDRWMAAYRQAGALQESDDAEIRKRGDCATGHAVRNMHKLLTDLQVTQSRSLGDVALKARIVHEFQRNDWYGKDADANLDRGEKVARVMLVELMEMAGLAPMEVPDFEPGEVLPGYVEPAEFLQAAE